MTTNVKDAKKCLSTLLCWLQSADCDESVFDSVSKHGEFPVFMDSILEIQNYIDEADEDIVRLYDKLRRRNIQIADLKQQVEKLKDNSKCALSWLEDINWENVCLNGVKELIGRATELLKYNA